MPEKERPPAKEAAQISLHDLTTASTRLDASNDRDLASDVRCCRCLCRSWNCPYCGRRRKRLERRRFCELLRLAARKNARARFYTFTAPPGSELFVEEFQRRLRRLIQILRRSRLLWHEWRSVWGVDPETGSIHRHLVAIGGPFIDKALLGSLAERVGLGFIDVRLVDPTEDDRRALSAYLAANALGFALFYPERERRFKIVSGSRGRRGR